MYALYNKKKCKNKCVYMWGGKDKFLRGKRGFAYSENEGSGGSAYVKTYIWCLLLYIFANVDHKEIWKGTDGNVVVEKNVVDDEPNKNEMKRHRLERNRGRKKYHYVYNQNGSDIRLPRPNRFITNMLEGKIPGLKIITYFIDVQRKGVRFLRIPGEHTARNCKNL